MGCLLDFTHLSDIDRRQVERVTGPIDTPSERALLS